MMYRVSFLSEEKAVMFSISMNIEEREQLERALATAEQARTLKNWAIEASPPMSYVEFREFLDREGFFNLKDVDDIPHDAPWPYDWERPGASD